MRGRGGGFGSRGAFGMGTYGMGLGQGMGLGMGRGMSGWPGNPYPYCRNFPWLPRRWWSGIYGPISPWQATPNPYHGAGGAYGAMSGYGTYTMPPPPTSTPSYR